MSSIARPARVAALLERRGVETALIGAAALAAHGYARGTADLDLGTVADPFTTLRELLAHNPDADLAAIRAVCETHGLEARLDALTGAADPG